MKILFLCGLFPKETEEDILKNSIGSIQNAANNLQWGFVEGFEENLNEPITILNSLYIGSFPRLYKRIKIDTHYFSHNGGKSQDINVGFINVVGVKRISRYISLKPYIKEWIESNKDSKKIIIAYAMTSTFTQILEYSKKIDESVVTCLIVPDLPQYMNFNNHKNIIYTKLKNIEMKIIRKNMQFIDSYVLLTQYMKDALEIKKPYVVIEGISTDLFKNISKSDENMNNSHKNILYTGGLNEKYGIIDLVKAFEMLEDKNCRLIICGSGDAENFIRKACGRDKRIIFKGLLDREEILSLQKGATLLINPRANTDDYTKFSFPSKMLEYMSSGRPVLAYMLDGMPDEYREYIYEINENVENGILNALVEVLKKSKEELYIKGKKAKEFVLKEKNSKKQCKKVIDMITKLK